MFRKYNIIFILLFFFAFKEVYGQNNYKKYVFREKKMGSPFTIVIYGKDSTRVARIAKTAFYKVDTLNNLFSDYIDSSEINLLSSKSGNHRFIPVSQELFYILSLSKKASYKSKGAFDITIGPVVKLWRKARRENIFPESDDIKKALKRTGYKYIQLNKKDQSVRLDKAGMQLDLGGIAKGYIAQVVLDFLIKENLPAAMVNAGGDIALGAPPPDHSEWKIGISLPEEKHRYSNEILLLKNQAVATSGDIYQYLEWKGKHYSHIINPKTGIGVTSLRNVTVVANNGGTADWLASACSILSIREAFQLVKKFPKTALFIAEKRGDRIYKKGNKYFYKLLR